MYALLGHAEVPEAKASTHELRNCMSALGVPPVEAPHIHRYYYASLIQRGHTRANSVPNTSFVQSLLSCGHAARRLACANLNHFPLYQGSLFLLFFVPSVCILKMLDFTGCTIR